MFSRRVPSDFTENTIARALAVRTRPYIDLTASNPAREGLSPSNSEIHDALDGQPVAEYRPDPRGLLSAREAVAAEYAREGTPVDPSRIFLTASTSEAYAQLFKLLCDPGDPVLVPEPSYPLFDHLTALEGIRKKAYRLVRADSGGWELDIAGIVGGLDDGARALLLVHPNNPTGSYVRQDELGAIRSSLDSATHAVISDEVFHAFRLCPPLQTPLGIAAISDPPVLTFSLAGLSKSCALPQMKLAWVLVGGPAEIVARASERLDLISDTYLSVSTPVQLALPKLLAAGRRAASRIRDRLIENLQRAMEILGVAGPGGGTGVILPEGGWSLPLALVAGQDEERCVLDLLETRDVLVSPGWFFEFGDEPHLVLSLLAPPEDFREAARRIRDYLSAGGV
jgi:aspartate/methionine/tyrosine aminotransferase